MNYNRAISAAATVGFVVLLIVFMITFQNYSALYTRFRKDMCTIAGVTRPQSADDPHGWIDCGPNYKGACVRAYTGAFPGVMVNQQFPIQLGCTFTGDWKTSKVDQSAWAARIAQSLINTTRTCYHDTHPVTAVYLDKPPFAQMGGLIVMVVLLFVFGGSVLFLCVTAGDDAAKMGRRAPFMAEAAESPLLSSSTVNTPAT